MKPMTTDEIARLKIWTEKQAQRRPNEILYQDILRLIATIEELTAEQSKGFDRGFQAGTIAEREGCKQVCKDHTEYHRRIMGDGYGIRMSEAHSIMIDIGARSGAYQPNIQAAVAEVSQSTDQAINWPTTPHWYQGMDSSKPCELCNQAIQADIHDPRLRGHQADPAAILKLNTEAGSLKSALEAIKPGLDSNMGALVDELIKGEES